MQTHYKQLTDSQWQVMKTSLPIQRKRKHDLSHRDSPKESFPKGMPCPKDSFGAVWAFGKESLGPLGVVYYYYRKWKRNGVLSNLTWKLNTLFRQQKSKKSTPSILSIDSQSVKKSPFVHEQTGIDGNKKVNGRKRHILMPIRKDSFGIGLALEDALSKGLLRSGMGRSPFGRELSRLISTAESINRKARRETQSSIPFPGRIV